MYLFRFISNLTKKNNLPLLLYIILTLGLLLLFACYPILFFSDITIIAAKAGFIAVVVGFVVFVYLAIITLTLSPIGEWLIRRKNGCTKIVRKDQLEIIEPIFNEVYSKTKEIYPDLPNDITIFISSDKNKEGNIINNGKANAYAIGRKTICVAEGFFNLPEDKMKAILGHELGRIANFDIDAILVIYAGNITFIAFLTLPSFYISAIIYILMVAKAKKGERPSIIGLIVNPLYKQLWEMVGTWICNGAFCNQVFLADEVVYNLGFGKSLCEFLDNATEDVSRGLPLLLKKGTPATAERIFRLQKLGCEYTKTY